VIPVDELPELSGPEEPVADAVREGHIAPVYAGHTPLRLDALDSACAIALHMHQPLIPAGPDGAVISNLQWMLEHPGEADNHNAPVFRWCYARMGEFIPQLLAEGYQPRVMLDYSGTLLHGLRRMGASDVLDPLRRLATDPDLRGAVEWLGCPWGHAVAPSTPVQDYRLHVRAWQHHFAALFGAEALGRVRGFSPAEMALPNHPDVGYAFVRTLLDCGFDWVLVQEHTVELPDGRPLAYSHLPHRLVCTSSAGETAEIVAVVKTQGSDTKLVAQMQPYYEARGLRPVELAGLRVPPLVTQIADGENGGVMMNEFPPKFMDVIRECSGSDTPAMNVTEYLEHLAAIGIQEKDFPTLQPLFQKRIWDRLKPGAGPEKLAEVIQQLKKEDNRFHVEGGSWTNNISWVQGYDHLLGPMERTSSLFYQRAIAPHVATNEPRFRNALFHLLCSQTSCYRYWGSGIWTDYGRELCRRADAILTHDFNSDLQ